MAPSRTDDVPFRPVHPGREALGPEVPGPVVTDGDRAIARLLLAGAALGGAWLVLRVPGLRRVAWRGLRTALVSGLPALIAREVRQSWRASRPRTVAPAAGEPATPAAVPPPGPFSGA